MGLQLNVLIIEVSLFQSVHNSRFDCTCITRNTCTCPVNCFCVIYGFVSLNRCVNAAIRVVVIVVVIVVVVCRLIH